MTASKYQENWTRNIPHDIALELAQNRFSGEGWQALQSQFDQHNAQFFNNILPNVLIVSGYRSSSVGGKYMGRAILISKDSPFVMHMNLLHEMQHLYNNLMNIYDYDHGFGWVNSLDHIHQVLNINVDIRDWTKEEAEGWPLTIFKTYELEAYFEKSFNEYGGPRPLPSDWQLNRKSMSEQEHAEIICKGDPIEDLAALEEEFGAEYILKIKEKIWNTK